MSAVKAAPPKWKIQVPAPVGWGDLKALDDSGQFVDDHYAKMKDADLEARQFMGRSFGRYRIVPADTPSDHDFYPSTLATIP